MYTRNQVLLGSADGSQITSNPFFIGDFDKVTVSRQTSTASAVNMTIQGSNDDGFTAAIGAATWSTLTSIPGAGLYTIDPGFRWLRSTRSIIGTSAASNETHVLEGKTV